MKNEKPPFDLAKVRRTVTWKFRGFLVGLVLSIAGIAFGALLIHPGLAIMVISSALTFFAHVNAKMLDETLIRIRQAEMVLAATPKEPTGDILKDYNPGGYH